MNMYFGGRNPAERALMPSAGSCFEIILELRRGQGCNLCKPGRIRNGQIRKNLAVKLNAGPFQTIDKLAVGNIVHAGACIDSGNPESSEITFALPAIPVGIHQRLVYRISGRAKQFTPAAPEAFGQL